MRVTPIVELGWLGQWVMGVGGMREVEGFVPSPYYSINLSPFKVCWTPYVLWGGYIP